MKKNILLVDDHNMIIDALKTMIESQEEYSVIAVANDGDEALEYLMDHTDVDIVISDIKMKRLNGIDLCKAIKKKNREIKVLMLTMFDNENVVNLALDAEADGYILKNSSRADLFKALDTIWLDGYFYDQNIIPIIQERIRNEKIYNQKINHQFTARELEILKLICYEYTSEQISKELFISKKTVDNHRANILHKTGCKSTIGLVKYALSLGL